VEVVAQSVRGDDEKDLQPLAIPFVSAPVADVRAISLKFFF
jgi:hypothetical protein